MYLATAMRRDMAPASTSAFVQRCDPSVSPLSACTVRRTTTASRLCSSSTATPPLRSALMRASSSCSSTCSCRVPVLRAQCVERASAHTHRLAPGFHEARAPFFGAGVCMHGSRLGMAWSGSATIGVCSG